MEAPAVVGVLEAAPAGAVEEPELDSGEVPLPVLEPLSVVPPVEGEASAASFL